MLSGGVTEKDTDVLPMQSIGIRSYWTCSITSQVLEQVLHFFGLGLSPHPAKMRFHKEVVSKLKFPNNSMA